MNDLSYTFEVNTAHGSYYTLAELGEDVPRKVFVNALANFSDAKELPDSFEIRVYKSARIYEMERPKDLYYKILKNNYCNALSEIRMLKDCIGLLEGSLMEKRDG